MYMTRNPFEHLKELDRFMVGGGDMWDRLTKAHQTNVSGFPPYNTRKVDDNRFVVELALSGFSKDEIDITVEDNKLIIRGSVNKEEVNQSEFLYKGIATRNFTRMFMLDDYLEVKGADLTDGLLKVYIERIIPPEKLPKKIEIGKLAAPAKPQLLTE